MCWNRHTTTVIEHVLDLKIKKQIHLCVTISRPAFLKLWVTTHWRVLSQFLVGREKFFNYIYSKKFMFF